MDNIVLTQSKRFFDNRMTRLRKCDAEVRRRNDVLEANLATAKAKKEAMAANPAITSKAHKLSFVEICDHYQSMASKNQRNSHELFVRNWATTGRSMTELLSAMKGVPLRKYAPLPKEL